MTFGITKERGDDCSKFVPGKVTKPLLPRPNDLRYRCNQFLSIGSLERVGKLDVWRNEARCFGLWIEDDDQTVQILGQWDPSRISEISRIYDGTTQGTLQEICFCFRSASRTVANILLAFGDKVSIPIEDRERVEKVFYLNDLTKVSGHHRVDGAVCLIACRISHGGLLRRLIMSNYGTVPSRRPNGSHPKLDEQTIAHERMPHCPRLRSTLLHYHHLHLMLWRTRGEEYGVVPTTCRLVVS